MQVAPQIFSDGAWGGTGSGTRDGTGTRGGEVSAMVSSVTD